MICQIVYYLFSEHKMSECEQKKKMNGNEGEKKKEKVRSYMNLE